MERRRAARRVPSQDEPISRARLRTGQDLDVIDISDVGVQVEGSPRLLPGTHVELHVVASDGRVLIRSRVVRSFVHRLHAELVRYRAALTFERSVDTSAAGYEVPKAFRPVAAEAGIAYPASRENPVSPQARPLPHRDLRAPAQLASRLISSSRLHISSCAEAVHVDSR